MSDGDNRHYVPEWLLHKFRRPCLYELDIYTGKTPQRNPRKAGSGGNLWPQDIEDHLSQHDNQAGRIYRNRIEGRERITLSDSERWDFALWLAWFMPRVPTTRHAIKLMADEAEDDPHAAIQLLYKERTQAIAAMRDHIGHEQYRSLVAEYGKLASEELLLATLASRIRRKAVKYWPDADDTYHGFLRTTDVERFARILCERNWVWLYSQDGFVIGDNPLVRWHRDRRRWDFGIISSRVEITMPLGLNLCLRLDHRHWQHRNHLLHCSVRQTRRYNCRQRFAAIEHVYGNSSHALDFITRRAIC